MCSIADGQAEAARAAARKAVDDTFARVRTLIYALLYPAFLGTFLVNLFQYGWPWGWDGWLLNSPPWPYLFVIYFVLQYMEGAVAAPKSRVSWFFDLAEITLMTILFYKLGYLGPDGNIEPKDVANIYNKWTLINLLSALIFAIPVLKRIAEFICRYRNANETFKGFYLKLSILSILATIAVLASMSALSFYCVALLLAIYAIFFQFLNSFFFSPDSQWSRPSLQS